MIDSTTQREDDVIGTNAREAWNELRGVYASLSLADDLGEHIDGDALRELVRRTASALGALDGVLCELGADVTTDGDA